MMLKSRFGAYDGRGNAVVANAAAIPEAWKKLGGHEGKKLYVEKWAPFKMELAVMVPCCRSAVLGADARGLKNFSGGKGYQ